MDKPQEITDLGKVIEPYLNGGQLVSYSSRYLTKPGDNYGSLMLAISANIRQPNGAIEELPLVAKLPPLTNEIFWNLFKPEITSIRENAIYQYLAPSVREIQLEAGIPEDELDDVFAKFYGCRISLDENATVLDRDAVLVLENMQTSGYRAGKRQIMYDYAHIKTIFTDVAKYHALPIALRLRKPEKFEKEIFPYFLRYDLNTDVDPETEKTFTEQKLKEVQYAIGHDKEAFDRYKEVDEEYMNFMANKEQCPHGLFTTIAHYDMWINNLMILYDENGAPKKVKVVDFQISQYESLVHDLIFLLFTSVETEVLENNYHELLKHYYDEFIACLTRTKCDVSEYSFEKFMEEINRTARLQISHAVFMSKVLLTEQHHMPDNFENVSLETLQAEPSPALVAKLRDIFRLSKKFGFF